MRIAAAIAFGIFTMTALSAHADESSGSQWRFTETSLFELIQNGYSIAAVTTRRGAYRIIVGGGYVFSAEDQ